LIFQVYFDIYILLPSHSYWRHHL